MGLLNNWDISHVRFIIAGSSGSVQKYTATNTKKTESKVKAIAHRLPETLKNETQ